MMKLMFNVMIKRENVKVSSFEKLTIILVSYSVWSDSLLRTV